MQKLLCGTLSKGLNNTSALFCGATLGDLRVAASVTGRPNPTPETPGGNSPIVDIGFTRGSTACLLATRENHPKMRQHQLPFH